MWNFFLIFLFLKVNKKVKRRRSSLVSTRYNTTINQNHNHFIYPIAQLSQTTIQSKKLFNLRGRNKRENAQTLAQHMKTLNMVSVYILMQPRGGSDGGGEGAVEKQTSTSNNNRSQVANEDEDAGIRVVNVTPATPVSTVDSTFRNSLSFEIRRVDGDVIMMDAEDDEEDESNSAIISRTTKTDPGALEQQEDNAASSKVNSNLLGVKLLLNNATSSSFNSTGSSRISSLNPNEEDISSHECVGLVKTKQICVSLEDNVFVTSTIEKINDNEEECN